MGCSIGFVNSKVFNAAENEIPLNLRALCMWLKEFQRTSECESMKFKWNCDWILNLLCEIKLIFIGVYLCISGVSACTLTCLSGNSVRTYGNVADGTRCDHQNPFVYDVCINGQCQVLLNSRLNLLYPIASFDTRFWPQVTSIFGDILAIAPYSKAVFFFECVCVFYFLELESVYINLVHIRCSHSGKLRSESRSVHCFNPHDIDRIKNSYC